MSSHPGRPKNDASSAPESGTVRNKTSGNQSTKPHERGAHRDPQNDKQPSDDPSEAGEER
jgi:hypothetical protein